MPGAGRSPWLWAVVLSSLMQGWTQQGPAGHSSLAPSPPLEVQCDIPTGEAEGRECSAGERSGGSRHRPGWVCGHPGSGPALWPPAWAAGAVRQGGIHPWRDPVSPGAVRGAWGWTYRLPPGRGGGRGEQEEPPAPWISVRVSILLPCAGGQSLRCFHFLVGRRGADSKGWQHQRRVGVGDRCAREDTDPRCPQTCTKGPAKTSACVPGCRVCASPDDLCPAPATHGGSLKGTGR